MKRGQNIVDWLSGEITMRTDTPSHLPLVEICGDKRVLIEHHRGILQYGQEKICVQVAFGQIAICGTHLKMVKMTNSQLVIFGCIEDIKLIRRG